MGREHRTLAAVAFFRRENPPGMREVHLVAGALMQPRSPAVLDRQGSVWKRAQSSGGRGGKFNGFRPVFARCLGGEIILQFIVIAMACRIVSHLGIGSEK